MSFLKYIEPLGLRRGETLLEVSVRWTACLMPLLAFTLLWADPTKEVAVASAASLRGTLEEVKAAFEARNSGVRIRISYGASGSLTAQIQQGAPVDVFLSADLGYPERLVQAGLADKVVPYARGLLVLWVRKDLGLDSGTGGLTLLQAPAVKRIALANPRLAPYGRAAETALARGGLAASLEPRLVRAENVNQAAQYLYTNAAEAGFIAASLLDHPGLKAQGIAWPVPEESYDPIVQGGAVLVRSRCAEEARAFLAFLIQGDGAAILQRHGFGKP